jgi:hypothetical protein
MKTYADIVSLISSILQDNSNATYSTSELDLIIPEGLTAISRFKPREVRETTLITVSSRDITLSAENKRNLLDVWKVEYPVGQYPKTFRGFTMFGDLLNLDLYAAPTIAASLYLYLLKRHILQKEVGTTDLAGAVKTQGTAGDSTLALKSLGTGTINENTLVAIAGDSTIYTVTKDATIGTNEATVSITPVLGSTAAVDTVVTMSLSESTLDASLEYPLAQLCAGLAAISKANLMYQESKKALTNLTNAASQIDDMADRVTAAIGDLSVGRNYEQSLTTLFVSLETEVNKMDTLIGQAVSDLTSGRALVNGIDTASAATKYANYAAQGVANARGYLDNAMGFAKQIDEKHSTNQNFISLAAHELQSANLYLNQSAASLRLAAQRTSVAYGAQQIERWGMNQKNLAETCLRKLAKPWMIEQSYAIT